MLNRIAFYACFNILHVLTRGKPQSPKTQGRSRPCWGHVGTFFALGRLLFALGRFLNTFWALLAHRGRFFRFFGRSGLDFAGSRAGFGAFKPTFFDFFLVLASTNHRSALHATKPQFLPCFIDFGTCRTQLPNVFFV